MPSSLSITSKSSTISGSFNAAYTIASNSGGGLNNLNTGLQVAASLAGISADFDVTGVSGVVAVNAGLVAAGTELAVLSRDASNGQVLLLPGDFVTLIGDLAITGSGAVNAFGAIGIEAKPLAAAFSLLGTACDIVGTGLNMAGGGLTTLISNVTGAVQTLLNSTTTTMSSINSGNSSTASNIVTSLDSSFQYVDSLLGNISSSPSNPNYTVLSPKERRE